MSRKLREVSLGTGKQEAGRMNHSQWEPEAAPQTEGPGRRGLRGKSWVRWGKPGAPSWTLTPGIMFPVITVLHMLGPRVEDVGAAALLDHALLEAGVDAHLQEKRVRGRRFRPALAHQQPRRHRGGKDTRSPVLHLRPSFLRLHTHTAILTDQQRRPGRRLPWKQTGLTCCVYLEW